MAWSPLWGLSSRPQEELRREVVEGAALGPLRGLSIRPPGGAEVGRGGGCGIVPPPGVEYSPPRCSWGCKGPARGHCCGKCSIRGAIFNYMDTIDVGSCNLCPC